MRTRDQPARLRELGRFIVATGTVIERFEVVPDMWLSLVRPEKDGTDEWEAERNSAVSDFCGFHAPAPPKCRSWVRLA
jgi:hypothetical protein